MLGLERDVVTGRGVSLYDVPPLYDLVIRPGPCETYYRQLARRVGGPVLELACGTGRLTIPIAADGHEVVGLDASPTMLRRARQKAESWSSRWRARYARADNPDDLNLTFVAGDMRSFDLARQFPLIIVSCNSLAHLVTNDELKTCFATVLRHLAPGGLFAFDVINPDVRALARDTLESVRLDLGPNPSSGIAVEETSAYDPVQQVRLLTWRVREPKVGVREVAPFRLRQIFPQELPLLLEASGLELAARHGDFDGNPLTGASLNQVCLARAPVTLPAIRSRVKAWPAPLRRRHASCRRLMRWRDRLRS
jgi:SAM-dependent methyltransferase